MIELGKKVFGEISAMEIIGNTPTRPDIEEKFNHELELLLKKLSRKNKNELKELEDNQHDLERLMNSRPGAMAISQEKIRLFTEFSQKYLSEIKLKIKEVQ